MTDVVLNREHTKFTLIDRRTGRPHRLKPISWRVNTHPHCIGFPTREFRIVFDLGWEFEIATPYRADDLSKLFEKIRILKEETQKKIMNEITAIVFAHAIKFGGL